MITAVVQGAGTVALLALLLHSSRQRRILSVSSAGASDATLRRLRWALREGYLSTPVLARWTGATRGGVARWAQEGIPACYEPELRRVCSLVTALAGRCSRRRVARFLERAAEAREGRRLARVLALDGIEVARAHVGATHRDCEAARPDSPAVRWRVRVRD